MCSLKYPFAFDQICITHAKYRHGDIRNANANANANVYKDAPLYGSEYSGLLK